MLVSDFHYDLPPERIAQEPLPDRAGSRLLHLNRLPGSWPGQSWPGQSWPGQSWPGQSWKDRTFREFPDLLRSDDLLVLNNTRVFPARLYGRRSGQRAQPLSPRNPASKDFLQGRGEVLFTPQLSQQHNERGGFVRPRRPIRVGECIYFCAAQELQP